MRRVPLLHALPSAEQRDRGSEGGDVLLHVPAAVERFDPRHRISVHVEIHDLKTGVDCEIEPPLELDPANWRQLRMFE
jgi:hypothetical protein